MDVESKISELIEPYLEKEELRLYKIIFTSAGKKSKLVIYVDAKEGHVNIDKLAALNRYAGDVIEAEDLIKNSYTLEVSSPGLVTLKEERDYRFFKGRYCKIVLEKETIYGNIVDYLDDDVVVLDVDGEEKKIEVSNILKAKLDVRF